MRKFAGALALLLIMAVAVLILPVGLPTKDIVAGPAQLPDGTVRVAENRLLVSRIYTLGEEDRVTQVYQESRWRESRESWIVRVTAEGENTYFLRVLGDGTQWELCRLNDKKAELLYAGTFDDPVTVTGLKTKEGTFWITALGENNGIFVYELTEQEGLKLKLLHPAWWLVGTVSAEFDGNQIRATTKFGDHCFVSPTGQQTYTDEAMETPTPTPVLEGLSLGLLQCKYMELTGALALWLVLTVSGLITWGICRRAKKLATRLTALACEILLLVMGSAVCFQFYAILHAAGLVAAWETLPVAATAAAAAWLVFLAALRLSAGFMTRLAPQLMEQMDQIVQGVVKAREVAPGRDELHQLDHSMQDMCLSLSIRDYELRTTVRSYQRFVPQEMTDLLQRANVAEVDLGDSRRIEGYVGVFSVENRIQARNTLEDGAFVDFINHSFGLFQDCIQENRGQPLSGQLRLEAMDAMFSNPGDGIRAGLDFLGQSRDTPVDGVPTPDPFLLFHKTSFLYGIAGKEERLFPYLSSGELEFLGGFARNFHEAGVRAVATESYWEELKDSGFTGRYIGFVSDEERDMAYKLYEVLDAYPKLERDLLICYDSRFQEAINLFYHNDFYLARNLFSALLRACPQDGVARWYLFACEYFFHQESGQADYRLFGLKEPAVQPQYS